MDAVNTILSVPAIVALVEVAKRLGLSSRLALVVALAIAVALSLSAYFWSSEGWYRAVAEGVLLGLAAAGIYDAADVTSGQRHKRRTQV